ncbi:YncE family protein, partial [Kitasatospora sp. NPDC093558]
RIDTDAPGPHWFAIDPAGRTGFATNKEAPFVSVVDLDRGVLTAKVAVPGSEGLAVSADGAHAFVAGPYASFSGGAAERPENGIRVVDARSASVVEVLPTDGLVLPVHLTSTGMLLAGELRMDTGSESRLGRHLPGRLTVFDAGTRKRVGSVEVGLFPLTITSSPDGRLAYVANVVSSTVDVVDLETLERVSSLDVARAGEAGAHGLAYIPRPA